MSVHSWEHFFKPEVRTRGRSFLTQKKATLSQPSDTEVIVYVQGSTSYKVTFKTSSVASKVLNITCTCPAAKKGQFCKHAWAGLLLIEKKTPDFLESKTELEKASAPHSASTRPSDKPAYSAEKNFRTDFKDNLKEKQAQYRKLQYQKQKARLQEIKASKKKPTPHAEFPAPIESALNYFSQNGFHLRDSLTKDSVSFAMKKLARLFHPDAGGTHSEFLELNKNADILTKFSKS